MLTIGQKSSFQMKKKKFNFDEPDWFQLYYNLQKWNKFSASIRFEDDVWW